MSVRAALRRGLPAAPSAGVSAPADRHYRRSDLRPGRRRRIGHIVVRAVRLLIRPALLVVAATWAFWSLSASPYLQVDHLAIRGNVRLSAGEIEALVSGMRGENLLSLEFEPYRRRLMESQWVQSVSLSRVLPSTVEIRVTERVPMAIGRLAQQLYLVDPTGVIVDAYGPQYRDFDLPIVDGLIDPAGEAAAIAPERLAVTARLLAAFAARTDLRDRLSQVDVSNPRDVVLMIDDDTAHLHVGDREFVERLQTYLEVGPALRDQLAVIDYVDLRYGERIYARAAGRTASLSRMEPRRP